MVEKKLEVGNKELQSIQNFFFLFQISISSTAGREILDQVQTWRAAITIITITLPWNWNPL